MSGDGNPTHVRSLGSSNSATALTFGILQAARLID
jgi:hypothetical protein